MDKDLHNIEDLFKSALDDNEEMPSAKVWNSIDNRLDKDTVIIIKKKYNTLKRLLLLLMLIMTGIIIFELNQAHTKAVTLKTNGRKIGSGTVANKNAEYNNSDASPNNTMASKEQTDLKDLSNNTSGNTNTAYSIDKNTEGNVLAQQENSLLIDKSGINFITGKQQEKELQADVKAPVRNSYPLKFQPALINEAIRQETRIDETGTAKQNATKDNSTGQIKKLILLPLQLKSLPDEKRVIADTNDPKKSVPSALNNTMQAPDVKNALSKQTKKQKLKPSRLSLTGFFSPDIASYSLEDDDITQSDDADQIKQSERHEFSSTSGLLVDYELNKRWSLQSGLTFYNTNILVEPKTIYAKADKNGDLKYRLNLSSGYGYLIPTFQAAPTVGDSLNVTAIAHKLRYLSIPVAVKYNTVKGRIKIEFMAGVSTNFLTMGKVETEIQQGPKNEIDILNDIQGLKSIYFNGMAGIGAEYKLNNKFSFILMPTARFALNPINKGAVVKTYPNSVGVAGGLRITF